MTAPALTTWTCRAELEAMEDTELADALRVLAALYPRPVAQLLTEAAARLSRPPTWCPFCDGGE